MVIGTRKSNSSVHPGAILQNTNRKPRRNRKQIDEDKARAAVSTAVAEEEAAAKHQYALTRIAELQAAVNLDEDDVRAHTLRPDLRVR
jgi:hypothetical protein